MFPLDSVVGYAKARGFLSLFCRVEDLLAQTETQSSELCKRVGVDGRNARPRWCFSVNAVREQEGVHVGPLCCEHRCVVYLCLFMALGFGLELRDLGFESGVGLCEGFAPLHVCVRWNHRLKEKGRMCRAGIPKYYRWSFLGSRANVFFISCTSVPTTEHRIQWQLHEVVSKTNETRN